MFNLAYATDLEETYNKIKGIDTGGFPALSSELKTYIVSFADNMGSLFDSANSSWACSTKDSADNSVATIKASLESIKPSAELVGEVGPLVRNAIDNIGEYIEAYQNYTQVKKSKPSETIRDVDAKGNQVRKANPAYATWKDVTLPNAYYNASNLENTSRASLNSITACLSGQKVSNATISPVSLDEGQFMVEIEETLPDGNVKRGYKVQDAEGNILKEIYNITNENNIVIQKSIVTYDREKNTRSEEYTLYYSNGDVVNGTKEYDQQSRVVSDIYTDTNGNKHTVTNRYVSDGPELEDVKESIESVIDGKKVITKNQTRYSGENAGKTIYNVYYEDNPDSPIKEGTIWYDSDQNKHDNYNLFDSNGNYMGEGEKIYNSNDILTMEKYKSLPKEREGTITYSEDGSKVDEYKQGNSDGSVDEGTVSYDTNGKPLSNAYTSTSAYGRKTDVKIIYSENQEVKTETEHLIGGEKEIKETTVVYDQKNGEQLSRKYVDSRVDKNDKLLSSTIKESGINEEGKEFSSVTHLGANNVKDVEMKVKNDDGTWSTTELKYNASGKLYDQIEDGVSVPVGGTSSADSTPVTPSETYEFDGNFGGSKTRDEIRNEVLREMFKFGMNPDEELIDSQVEYRYNNQNNQ